MTPQELKNSILQLAIQGKLVEQRSKEGKAEELYQQIQQEKQRLIKEGKIKKDKPLPEITEEEKPFDIPGSWKWVHWGEVVNVVSARRVHQSDWRNNGVPFYRAREIAKLAENGFVDNELFITEQLYQELSQSGVPHVGDIMVTAVGTLGKSYIVQKDDRFYYKDASVICLENYAHLVPEYLKYVMQSEMMMSQVRANSSGTTVATLTIVRMNEYIISLPPLAEQKRIVAKIEELLPLIDRYEKAWSRLEEFNKRFPDDMQKSILQMAIQGKLVEQRPEEGTGEDLYQQIQQEKQKLIKEGKIKKEKPFSTNTKYIEYPFDIPGTWTFVRFGDLMISRDSERIPVSTEERSRREKVYDYYGASGIIDKIDDYLFDKDLLLIGEDGANLLNRSTPIAFIAKGKYWVNNHAHVLDTCAGLLMEYICYYINAISLAPYVTGTAQPKMNQENMNAIWVPLPPVKEQKRIVEKIEELLPLCQKLSTVK